MRVEIVSFRSRLLEGNPLGDPAERRLAVCLPDSAAAGGRRYPVVYLLPGFGSRGTMMLNEALWEETIAERLARLIAGGMPPVIAVLPDCTTRYGASQYINSDGTGRYEDYLVEEIVPFVERTWPVLPGRDHRAVAGKSSGGYGATVLAMRHPDVFAAAADHSGDKLFDLCYRADIPRCAAELARYDSRLENFLKRFPHPPWERGPGWWTLTNMVAMASCYSPNPAAPGGLDLPFDPHTAEIREEVWARWLAQDPVHMVSRHVEALRSLRAYYLDCGNRDEHGLHYGARAYVRRLRGLGVAHTYEEFPGGHRGTSFRYDVSLPILARAISG